MVYLYAKAFPLGEGGPQGRMRGDLPSLPGKWAATATRPSSVTFGDSFPPMGEASAKSLPPRGKVARRAG